MPKQNTENKSAEQDARASAGDDFDKDLERDNHRHGVRSTMSDPAGNDSTASDAGTPASATGSHTDEGEFPQHARKGQAQSPVEETLNQPEPKREGHPGGARDS